MSVFPQLGLMTLLSACLLPLQRGGAGQDPGVVSGGLGKKLDAAVRALDPPFWGSVLVAVEDRVALGKGYGLADRALWPITQDSFFDIGSLSKVFTAAAILKLEMLERLELDDSIAKHLPDVPPDKHAITIRQLLQHSSGIPHDRYPPDPELELDEFVAFVLAGELSSPPGTSYQYNNIGYSLLAAIIELTSGYSFERFLKERIFTPASMKESGFLNGEAFERSRTAQRALRRGGKLRQLDLFDYPWNWTQRGATGVVSSAEELFRWTRVLEIERVLDEPGKLTMFAPDAQGHALGWNADELGGRRRWWHGGGTGGYRARLAIHPDDRVAVIALSDRSDLGALEAQLSTIALTYSRGLSDEVLALLAGRYSLDGANRFELSIEEGQPVLSAEGTRAASLMYFAASAQPGRGKLLEQLEVQARDSLRVVAKGELDAARAAFADFESARVGLDAWAVTRSEFGRFSHATVLGSHSGDEQVTFVRAHFERGDAVLRLKWASKKKLASLERWTEPVTYRLTMTPLTNEELVAKTLDGEGEITLRFGDIDLEAETPSSGFELRARLPIGELAEGEEPPEPEILRAYRLPE